MYKTWKKLMQDYLIDQYGIETCRRIYNDVNDVNHNYYQTIFEGVFES